MKKLLALTVLAFAVSAQAVETKQVCHDRVDKAGRPVADKKTGKTAQDCKTVKIHKQVEGTPVPEKSTKKK